AVPGPRISIALAAIAGSSPPLGGTESTPGPGPVRSGWHLSGRHVQQAAGLPRVQAARSTRDRLQPGGGEW
ncbi:MAG TPA: hypothetical protein VK356_13335, partial [Thermomicrobiales bacterium]|nr:hypothetical protein [Thermomicrobiales bacterium]